MGTAANAKIEYESAQTLVAFAAMTDSGDHMVFTSAANVWSDKSGYAPDVRPDGILTGVDILTAGSGSDEVDNIAFTAWISGILKSVSATTTTITRATVSTHVINSIILTDATVSAVKGVEGTAFSTTRGAAGGPPYVPVGSIEIGQVKTSAQASAVIDSDEIFQTAGTHQERADYPLYRRPNNLGYGVLAASTSRKYAHVEFYSALDTRHTGATCKKIYIKYYTPTFVAIESNGFVPADVQSSQKHAQRFDKMLGYKTDSLQSSSFRAEVANGVSDSLIALNGQNLIFRFYPDASKAPYVLTLGTLRFLSAFPQAGPLSIGCVVIVKFPSVRFAA